ncbi:hypothetical protein S506_004933 [Salmonella enterica subsp. enterica serovar Oranienburg]|nr:hypothetical protein [Salmonella enterica]EDV3389900.1 hypothetical protein [Salmonella enterica subsp. enterica serovar Oranienburg]
MIAQAVTKLDNKTAHCQPPVLDRHTPFFRRILLPVEKYPGRARPQRLVPLVRLTDDKEYAVMMHEMASIPARSLGAVFCDASLHRTQVKAAIDFLLDGI